MKNVNVGNDGGGRVGRELEKRLRAELAPTRLVITDDSAQHAGHVGHRPEGETHFSVLVVSERFVGQSRVARQRLVFAAVGDLMPPIHALSIKALTPGETTRDG